MDAIVVQQLTKTYQPTWPWQRPITVLSDVSFSVRQGEIFGFLGHNGAGKTTTMKVLLGLLKATGGRVELLGGPVSDVDVHTRLGYLPESPYFYEYLTAEEFLCFYGRLARLPRAEALKRIPELLKRVDLFESRHKPLRKFSKGMLQRIGLAQALIHDPELVILDEPMSGLDPIGRKEVRDLILSLRDQGKTVFFSSHIVSDVEMICDRVGILVNGRMKASGRIHDLVNGHVGGSVEVICDGVVGDSEPVIKKAAVRILQRGNRCMLMLNQQDRLDDVLSAVRQAGGKLISVVPHKSSLEDIFLEQTNCRV
ncbi:ABC transporter ATP-binding protein [Nitrospira sp. KM1]|uniref:ABC transporter ATP-binding protein n=1 Tax=Nitrospira sp. KM1 TaxID=1936990 RepID=UPI0013A734E0|nr:ABC transporter ATP-binding protein [Nitrospira sp. KM1]BCA54480.1 ABC transporter ATP-binding protein [Nitrospira sp. KM1]